MRIETEETESKSSTTQETILQEKVKRLSKLFPIPENLIDAKQPEPAQVMALVMKTYECDWYSQTTDELTQPQKSKIQNRQNRILEFLEKYPHCLRYMQCATPET